MEHNRETLISSAIAQAARGARSALAVAAALVVLWSFAHVLARPMREADARGDRTEIVLLHWGNREEAAVVQSLVESFERANPDIRIKRINASANYFPKLQTMLASGDPPDVFYLNAYHLPKYVPQGVVMPVDELLERDAAAGTLPFDPEDRIPEPWAGFRFDGQRLGSGPLYGLPMSFTPMGFYYNENLFRASGVPLPTSDWTWDDFEHAARAVAEATGARTAVDLRGAQLLRLMLWNEGADLTDPLFRTVAPADDPSVRAVIERLSSWRDAPSVFRLFGAAEESVETSAGMFQAGAAAMQGPVGRWMVPNYREIESFEWGWAPLPRGSAPPRNMLYVLAFCIARDTEHPEAAWRVAKHFASPEGQEINSSLGLALPTLESLAHNRPSGNEHRLPRNDQVFFEAARGAAPMLFPTESRAAKAMQNAAFEMFSSGRASPERALARLQGELDAVHRSRLAGDFPPMPWRPVAAALGAGAALAALAGAALWWRGRPGRLAGRREIAGLLMASPWILGLLAFVAAPMVLSLLLSLSRWSGLTTLAEARFVGLANYAEAFTNDARFTASLAATALYAALAVPAGQAAALGAALLMIRRLPGVHFFRAVWYLPTVLAGVAMAVLWWWVFDTDYGLMNAALAPAAAALDAVCDALFGPPPETWGARWFAPPAWFGEDAQTYGVPAFAITSLWTIGGAMLIYIAGLAAIPSHLYEAARLDGAGPLRRFWNVTVPMLSPVILFNLIIAIIASFQIFTQAFVMTRGGPGDATLFYVLYVYFEAFESHNMGYASALAWLLLLVILALTAAVLRLSRRSVHYDGGRP